jgi:uncharacterized protein (TIGR02118 family)
MQTYYRIFEFWFDSLDDLQFAFGSSKGQAIIADVANIATGGLTILISETS